MKYPAAGFLPALVLATAVCSGQIPNLTENPSHYFEIQLPPGVASENVFVRYVLAGQEIGGWVQPRSGVSSYFISTIHNGRIATRIRALLYVPGCAIQAIDVPLSEAGNEQYSFVCHPLSSVRIIGAITRPDPLYGREISFQVRYVARWAQSFLGLRDDIPEIPLSDGSVSGGHFEILLPDFSQDALAGSAEYPGEIRIWARDRASGGIVAQLIPAVSQASKTRIGGLKIQSEYPSELVFTPCSANSPQVHDAFGFALRPDAGDACDP